MHIANPMYDTVFKYLLEDNALAKLLIGTILQEEILSLEFCPQERTQEIERAGKRGMTVYRMDFAARVRNVEGVERQVLIELQKAKFATDILRFRRYLSGQYRDPDNIRLIERDDGKLAREGIPILTIYFLGHALDHTEAPVVRVRRDCVDLASGQSLERPEPFIESLTHDSYVIQIPKLKDQPRNAIEEMLQLFDQSHRDRDRHYLRIDEADIPPDYRPLLRRLQQAAAEPEIADAMELEDEILEELQDIERQLEAVQARAEAEQARAEAESAEKERLLALLKAAGIDPNPDGPSSDRPLPRKA
ncbi:PD-(D/E)XK nuclease family transposase [Thiorhodovibrio winogradskyi]|uniref:PD-(D/E)XK nuclease family transposase n=1 Tax=Thiorhodovibrio winogradskyi TaxID=77007 RepID=A0ABZ0SE28_9GAMM|nr:hypothetical protein [Thiorhodovibrio winogradskyi]